MSDEQLKFTVICRTGGACDDPIMSVMVEKESRAAAIAEAIAATATVHDMDPESVLAIGIIAGWPSATWCIDGLDPDDQDQEEEQLRAYDVTVMDTCKSVYRVAAFDEDGARDRALELYEAGIDPAEYLGITDRVLRVEEVTRDE